ncbi:MAG: acetyl-CoA carboxylase carboxyltransferase subunit beta [Saprospiraceae bacterium]|nr:acetyl-CoA carboxylase carboxyltransferase subunit beta [Saprospiraceae bacterium]MBP7699255.1 acetyl-CoA carboxylase carboxyltransferase subunit beta [Saprospiraceae bacterium]
MSWFNRLRKGIQTATNNKKEAPDGIWSKCKRCGTATITKEFKENNYVCANCNYHTQIGSEEYFEILFDGGKYTELFNNLVSKDLLQFVDLKPYKVRLEEAVRKTDLKDALSVGEGKVNKKSLIIACMDFRFIGGSMGSVVGEKISRAIDHAINTRTPLLIISKSGGARMMESAFSLMQMAKTSAKLSQLSKKGIPFISLMTDPTTGGVTASFAMLGDINIAEPEALIGFAGPRVIKETIKRDLPEGFQTSEFLVEKGFLDFIVHRNDLKDKLTDLLAFFVDSEPLH